MILHLKGYWCIFEIAQNSPWKDKKLYETEVLKIANANLKYIIREDSTIDIYNIGICL